MVNLLFWGLTVGVVGKVMLAVGVLWAHSSIVHEHRIDKVVEKSFRLERWVTIAGLLLIVLGYAMEITFYNFETTMLTCLGEGCASEAAAWLSQ